VGPDIPERAFSLRHGEEAYGLPGRTPTRSSVPRRLPVASVQCREPLTIRLREASREEDHRGDTGEIDCLDQMLRTGDGGRERLVAEEVLAGAGSLAPSSA